MKFNKKKNQQQQNFPLSQTNYVFSVFIVAKVNLTVHVKVGGK
jgi:hypothetical protein